MHTDREKKRNISIFTELKAAVGMNKYWENFKRRQSTFNYSTIQ